MIAMVLAAGHGTRLRPLTDRIAKPALPLLGDTLLGLNLALVKGAGIDEVVVNAHHLSATVAAAAREAADRLSLRLHLSFEQPAPLGTGGALVAARPLLDRGEPFLLLNGDVLTDIDPRAAIDAHRAAGAVATMVLRQREPDAPYAPVEVDPEGWVARIAGLGREPRPGEALRSFTFTGIHVLSPAIFEVLPAQGAACVNRQGHVQLIERGLPILGHVEEGGRWSDVGTPERYREANLDLLEGRYRIAAAAGAEALRPGSGALQAPTAVVEAGANLVAPCYVGADVKVRAGAKVGPRAVLLAGSEVRGEVRDTVVAPGAVVEPGRCEGRLVI